MRLPKDILTGNMTRPRLFLCESDKAKICMLDPLSMSGSFKFNAYSELTFTIGRTYINMITGETQVNPFYNKIEALRLVYLEGFGYFEIQDPEIVSDGIREVKNVTAYSLEYTLSQKYLEEFYINTGENNSVEVIYSEEHGTALIPVSLYNIGNPSLSLLNLALEKVYGWKIGKVDSSLRTMTRTFEISRASVYDFIVQDICENFNCFAVFDTVDNTINLYAEALITKHIGDGETTTFKVSPAYGKISTVSIDSYKTTKYTYYVDTKTNIGYLTFDEAPANGSKIEITDGDQTDWTTDAYVTFQNLAQEVNVSYSADDIKTVLTVKGAEDLDIREVNMGLPYIVDISYYYNVDWMGQELFDAYTKYIKKSGAYQDKYTENAEEILNLQNDISFAENRTSLGYGVDSSVSSTTVGTYYVISGGSYPNYHYTEVSLPADYNANTTYYKLNCVNVTEEKVHTLYSAIRKYFIDTHGEMEPEIKDIATRDETWEELLEELTEQFEFVSTEFATLKSALTPSASVSKATSAIRKFLDLIWTEMGRTTLKTLFLTPYEAIESANKDAGYADQDSEYYWFYYPVTIMLASLNEAIQQRQEEIDELTQDLEAKQEENAAITDDLLMDNNFTHSQLIRLSSFLREDEYVDDNFVETSVDTIETLMQTKQELLECGRIELSKLCEPKLAFSMDMANIYALPEFEPIIDQFQLGKLINVAIRDDYVKRARLLAVDINFDDFSDFTCEFGELTNLRTPSSIHADLLANALSAGKTVASNASYWNKGADMATATDLKIQQGLLSAIGGLYTSDQSVTIDDNGILLRKVNENGEFDPHQAWLKNNTILLSDDSFKTARTGLGEFTIEDQTFYGILAEAMLSGYIEGSTIVGGTLDIGNGTFKVDSKGNMTATSGKIAGWTIKKNALYKELTLDDTDYKMYLQVPDGDTAVNAFAVRSKDVDSDEWDTQFAVNYQGKLTAKNAAITGAITATSLTLGSDVTVPYSKVSGAPNLDIYIAKDGTVGSKPAEGSTGFKVSSSGLLQASNAVIYGKIVSSEGKIAGWDISSNKLQKELTIDQTDYQMYLQSPNGTSTTNAFAVRTKASSDSAWDVQFAVNYAGKMTAKNAHVTGTIVATDGTIAGYNIGPGGSYDNAIYKRVSGDGVKYEVGLKATSGDTDLAFYVKESTDSWSSSENTFYVRNNGQLYARNADITGKITASSGAIGSWKIGDMGNYTDSIYTTYCAASSPSSSNPEYAVFMRGKGDESTLAFGVKKRTSSSTSWNDADNPFYVRKDGYVRMMNANVTGTIHADSGEIGGCKINDGVLNIDAANIASGTIAAARIPNLSASKITTGTLDANRLDASVITTGNFSSKTLSTSNLTVASGCRFGVASEYNARLYTSGSYTTVEAYGPDVNYGISWYALIKQAVQQSASSREIKTEIHDFNEKYDAFFDNLNPQLYKYNFDTVGGYSMGYIWEETKDAYINAGLTSNDVGAVSETEAVPGGKELDRTDFIALNTWQIQKLKTRIEELENRLEALEGNDTK